MSVSVIIPCFNSEKTIERAIESVLCQEINDLEIVLIDDGSTDGTLGRLKKYKKWVNYKRQKNQGVSAARNWGIKLSTKPFIAFLDSDDQWLPGKLKFQLKIFEKYKDVALSGTGRNEVDEHGDRTGSFKNEFHGNLLSTLLIRNVITTSSVVLRRECLRGIKKPFSTEVKYGEDLLLWLELAVHKKFDIRPEVYLNYTVSSNERYLKKYSEEDLKVLYKKMYSVIKNNCDDREMRSFAAIMHFGFCAFYFTTGDYSKMLSENWAGIKTHPESFRNLIKFIVNILRFARLKIKFAK